MEGINRQTVCILTVFISKNRYTDIHLPQTCYLTTSTGSAICLRDSALSFFLFQE